MKRYIYKTYFGNEVLCTVRVTGNKNAFGFGGDRLELTNLENGSRTYVTRKGFSLTKICNKQSDKCEECKYRFVCFTNE